MSRSHVVLAFVILLLVAPLPACVPHTPGPSPRTVSVDASYDGRTVKLRLGGLLRITLEANPSTGYHWTVTDIGDGQVLEEAGHEFKPRDARPGLVGVGGQDAWAFKAIGRGTVRLLLAYLPPGRDAQEPAKTFDIRVEVD